MVESGKTIKEYAFIAFTLLGVLFGMMIMNFVFTTLGSSSSTIISDLSRTVVNESGAWLNDTTYTVNNASVLGFSGLTIIRALNTTDDVLIGVGNFTVVGTGFTNTTAAGNTSYEAVTFTYSYNYYSDQRNAMDDSSNNSLQAIVTYTKGSSAQFNTVSIAIILILLIGVFLIFWKIFVSGKEKGGTPGGSFG